MKLSVIFLFSLIIFACGSNSATTNQIDNPVSEAQTSNNTEIKPATPAPEQAKTTAIKPATPAPEQAKTTAIKPTTPTPEQAKTTAIKPTTPTPDQAKTTNSEDLISYIRNQIFNAINNGTLNNLDPSKLCSNIDPDKINSCISSATTQIQNAMGIPVGMANSNQKSIPPTSKSEKSLPNITYFAKNKSDRFLV